jgi:transcriptional regulator with XRE-family HTH domain
VEIEKRTLGTVIKELREKIGLTQKELAKKAEVELGYFIHIENDRRVGTPETIMRIAKALQLKPPSKLFEVFDTDSTDFKLPNSTIELPAALTEEDRKSVHNYIATLEYIRNQEHNAAIEAKYDRQLEAEAAANQQNKEEEAQLERISARARERAKAQPLVNRKAELENKS